MKNMMEVKLTEGKNREIRKVLNKLNFGVTPPFPPKTTMRI